MTPRKNKFGKLKNDLLYLQPSKRDKKTIEY